MSKTGSTENNNGCSGTLGCFGCLALIIILWILFFGGTLTIMGLHIKGHCC